jgi:hypothetical protein
MEFDNHLIIWLAGGVFLLAVACISFLLALVRLLQSCRKKKETRGVHKSVGVSGLEQLMLPDEYETVEASVVTASDPSNPVAHPSDEEVACGADSEGFVQIEGESDSNSNAPPSSQPWLSRRDPWKKLDGGLESIDVGDGSGELSL